MGKHTANPERTTRPPVDYVVYECVTLGEYDVRCEMLGENGQPCEWVGHVGSGRSDAEYVIAFHRGRWHRG